MPSERRKGEARKKVLAWASRAPWTTATVFSALTWHNPVAAGLLAVLSVLITSSAIALYRATTLPSLFFIALAVYIGLPAIPFPRLQLAGQPQQQQQQGGGGFAPEQFDAAVDAGTTVLATLGEWRDLAQQQWATRPGAFSVQAIGTLGAAALALSHVPTSSVVWLALCALLTVPGCISTGAVAHAQHAAQPSVSRAQRAVVQFLQGLETKINNVAAAVTDTTAAAASAVPPRPSPLLPHQTDTSNCGNR